MVGASMNTDRSDATSTVPADGGRHGRTARVLWRADGERFVPVPGWGDEVTERRYAACVAVMLVAIAVVASACVLCGCITIKEVNVFPNVRTDLRHDVRVRVPASQPTE